MGLAPMTHAYLPDFRVKRGCRKTVLFFWGAALFSSQVVAELTEYQVVQLGLENPQIQTQWQAQLEKARGEMFHAGRWDNPSIEYSREDLDLPSGTSEENTVWLRQKINIAGIKRLERQAAEKNYKAQQQQQSMAIRHWQLLLRKAFYQTLAAQEKLARLKQIQSRLATLDKMVKQRAERGDASRFDALRIEKELLVTVSKYASVKAKYTGLRTTLFSKIDAPLAALGGSLLPNESSLNSNTRTAVGEWEEHPQILAIDARLQSAELSARAAGRAHWPEVTIGIGRKELSEADFSTDGNTISLGITLPLFDRGRGEKRIAESSAEQLRAEKTLRLRQLEASYHSALQAFHTHTEAALQLQAFSSNPEHSLSRLGEISYRAGELSVMELLDAYQSDLETVEQFIDTALEARLAYIQLQHLRGE